MSDSTQTRWGIDDVRRYGAATYRIEVKVDASLYTRYPDEILDKLLRTARRTFLSEFSEPVDLDERDIRTAVKVGDLGGQFAYPVTIVTRWWPNETAVEIIGGEHDGTLLDYADAPRDYPLRLPLTQPTSPWVQDSDRPIALELHVRTLNMAGWNPVERRWLYA